MKLLTKNTDYAVRALLELGSEPDRYISARELAGRQEIPYQYLRRILQELIKHELVVSKEGAGGGVKLNKEPDVITINQLIEIFQGKIQLSECMFRKKLCANRPTCVLRHEIMRIEQIVNDEFAGLSIGILLERMKK